MSAELDTPERTLQQARQAAELLDGAHAVQLDDDDVFADLVSATHFLGRQYRLNGRTREAIETYEKALAHSRALNDRRPGVPRYRADLARCLRGLAHVYGKTDPDRAVPLYRQCLEVLEPLARDHPGEPEYRRDLAATWTGLGGVCDSP